eukprot:TRINITY_DN14811_c0_g1_i1.p1 TRINITY_DN14811_c0_g1~~TRINITY_DN14811_c0_g1_i1.p1  ORF type:complete len:490 (+),score=152.87 TRINITY_DN14811_c0_g1_i1:159-1628(+)
MIIPCALTFALAWQVASSASCGPLGSRDYEVLHNGVRAFVISASNGTCLCEGYYASGNSSFAGGLEVQGATQLHGGVGVDGGVTDVRGSLTVADELVTNRLTVLEMANTTVGVLLAGQIVSFDSATFLGASMFVQGGWTCGGECTCNGMLHANGGLQANQDSAINAALQVNGPAQLNAATTINGGTVINGHLLVNGGIDCNGQMTLSGEFNVTGTIDTIVMNSLVARITHLSIDGTTTLHGPVVSDGLIQTNQIHVRNETFLSGPVSLASNLTVAGTVHTSRPVIANDTITANADIKLGNASGLTFADGSRQTTAFQPIQCPNGSFVSSMGNGSTACTAPRKPMSLEFLETPVVHQIFWATGGAFVETMPPEIHGHGWRAILAEVFLTINVSDHVNFFFGTGCSTVGTSWVSYPGMNPMASFGAINKNCATCTYFGQRDNFTSNYGIWCGDKTITLTSSGDLEWTNSGYGGGETPSSGYIYMIIRGFYD